MIEGSEGNVVVNRIDDIGPKVKDKTYVMNDLPGLILDENYDDALDLIEKSGVVVLFDQTLSNSQKSKKLDFLRDQLWSIYRVAGRFVLQRREISQISRKLVAPRTRR